MRDGLDAEYTFAFGIDLESQLAAVQLEDRQIIRRSLDRNFPSFRRLLCSAIFRTPAVSQNGFDDLHIQRCTATVNQGLKYLLHMPADFKEQIPAVLDLIIRI